MARPARVAGRICSYLRRDNTVETFTELKDFVDNPHFHEQRRQCLAKLDLSAIDMPIAKMISGFAKLTCCFTLQSCYGHFVHNGQDSHTMEPLPASESITTVTYRIAYIAICIENSEPGGELFHDLRQLPAIDTEYIQFGCAEWFWTQQVNSFALQIEPKRFMTQDTAVIDYEEALHIEKTRNRCFKTLNTLVQRRLDQDKP